jgi:hypothetical protein
MVIRGVHPVADRTRAASRSMRICETGFCICGFLFRQIFLLRKANNKSILRQSQALWVEPRSTYNSPTWVSDRRGLPFSVMLAALEVKMWYRGDLSHIYLFEFSMYICEGVPLNCLRYSPCLDEYKYLDLQGSGTPIADFVDRFEYLQFWLWYPSPYVMAVSRVL